MPRVNFDCDGRSLREALFIVDTDANRIVFPSFKSPLQILHVIYSWVFRPAVFAAFSDKNRSLLVHRFDIPGGFVSRKQYANDLSEFLSRKRLTCASQ